MRKCLSSLTLLAAVVIATLTASQEARAQSTWPSLSGPARVRFEQPAPRSAPVVQPSFRPGPVDFQGFQGLGEHALRGLNLASQYQSGRISADQHGLEQARNAGGAIGGVAGGRIGGV